MALCPLSKPAQLMEIMIRYNTNSYRKVQAENYVLRRVMKNVKGRLKTERK